MPLLLRLLLLDGAGEALRPRAGGGAGAALRPRAGAGAGEALRPRAGGGAGAAVRLVPERELVVPAAARLVVPVPEGLLRPVALVPEREEEVVVVPERELVVPVVRLVVPVPALRPRTGGSGSGARRGLRAGRREPAKRAHGRGQQVSEG